MRIPSYFYLILLALLISCGNSENREIEEVLSVRTKAFETKDVELYMTCISPDYKQEKKGKVIGPEEIKKNFKINIDLFDTISLTHSDRTIYRDGNKAEVVQKTLVDAEVNESKSRFRLNEKIVLEKNDGKWVIVKESDADFLEGFVFGGN